MKMLEIVLKKLLRGLRESFSRRFMSMDNALHQCTSKRGLC